MKKKVCRTGDPWPSSSLLPCLFSTAPLNKVTNPCVQDYVAGQGNIRGNVNVEDYYERDASLC